MANTFSLPSAGKSFTLSLVDFNNSILATWSNFYGPSVPTSSDIEISGVATTPYPGMLYRSSVHRGLYVNDPSSVKGGSIGGNFTRVGIGNRNFRDISNLFANISTIEQTELISTIDDTVANYRLYMKTTNSGSIVDVGTPPASSLSTAMFINRQISNTHLQASSISGHELGPNIVYPSSLTIAGRVAYHSIAERTVVSTISGNLLTIDVGLAPVHHVNVTSHINAIVFSNTNPSYSWGVSVFFYGNGSTYNFNTNSNVKYPNSNTAIVLTSTAGRSDAISFISPNGSLPVLAFAGGQSF